MHCQTLVLGKKKFKIIFAINTRKSQSIQLALDSEIMFIDYPDIRV